MVASGIGSATHEVPGLETNGFTRTESDGSQTVLGRIQDVPGDMTRIPLPHRYYEAIDSAFATAAATSGQPLTNPVPPVHEGAPFEVGIFVRHWTSSVGPVATIGGYATDDAGQTHNVNMVVIEGADDLDALVEDVLQRDAMPIAVNSLPFILNYAAPTSITLLVATVLGGAIGLSVAAIVVAEAGYPELAQAMLTATVPVMFAPLFGGNLLITGGPYHMDPNDGELVGDFPDQFAWTGITRAGGRAVWDGLYIQRNGDYVEGTEFSGQNGENVTFTWDAWRRVVVGPAVRVDAGVPVKSPGVYLRQDFEASSGFHTGAMPFDAQQTISGGVYHDAVGESPGASVRMQESKRGEQTILYAPEQHDTWSIGVYNNEAHIPLLGTRSSAWHWHHNDVTNLGDEVAAIESYRIISVGLFVEGDPVGDAYKPIFGADIWNERYPLDLWALLVALGGGPGNQDAGDVQTRIGVFNHDERFVAIAGARWDDDFAKHDHDYRTMVSAGLFVANPLDPGPRTPGEAPDQAQYVPLVGVTYDSPQPLANWALLQAGGSSGETWRVTAGTFAGDRDAYLPVVGAEFVPQGYHQDREIGERYNVGILPGDYDTFIPVAGVTYDGDSTLAGWATLVALGGTSEWDTTQGVYVGGYQPLTGVNYRLGTTGHDQDHQFQVGHYIFGGFQPVAVIDAGATPNECQPGTVAVDVVGFGTRQEASNPTC